MDSTLFPAMPNFSDFKFEEPPDAAVTIDNRKGIQATTCLDMPRNALQDNLLQAPEFYVSETDLEPAAGCVHVDNTDTVGAGTYFGKYTNLTPIVLSAAPGGGVFSLPPNLSAPSGVWNEGVMTKGEYEGLGAGFGPSMLPFGSLPITTSPTTWATLCSTNCNVVTSNISAPDGPSGAMTPAEIDSIMGGGFNITVGNQNLTTYQGDVIIYGVWERPRPGEASVLGSRKLPIWLLNL